MDAIVILEREHAAAKKAMEEVAQSGTDRKEGLFKALKRELELHDGVEEGVFYPAVLSHPKTALLPGLDKKAHLELEAALDALDLLPVGDAKWSGSFKAMQGKLLKHVADEESQFFSAIREALSPAELMQLGSKMELEKIRLRKAA
jgi:hypothetical protein